MKKLIITVISVLLIIPVGCSDVVVEIKVSRQQEPVGTPAEIILFGSAIGSERTLDNVALPWSYSFTSEEGKILNVRACCGLLPEDTGITVSVYKDGSRISSKSGYSPTVRVML